MPVSIRRSSVLSCTTTQFLVGCSSLILGTKEDSRNLLLGKRASSSLERRKYVSFP